MARDNASQIPADKIAQKRDRFIRLAEGRTVNAIKAIRIIAKLGNKSHYDYDEADVKKIAVALTREVEAMKAQMLTKGGRETISFKL
jgi:hypothetical protein